MTTVAIIEPGAEFSTIDVATGLRAGIEAQGVKVVTYPLNINLQMYSLFASWADAEQIVNKDIDPFLLAQRGVVDFCVHYDVDAVIAVHGANLHPMAPLTLRKLAYQKKKPFPVALLVTESPYQLTEDVRIASAFDVVFVNEKNAVPHFKNARKHYLPHAYNPRVHKPGEPDWSKTCDAFFIGTAFEERKRLFEGVDWGGIEFTKLGFGWDGFDKEDVLRPRDVRKNADVAGWYRSARININQHRTTKMLDTGHIEDGAAYSIGPRAYEIAACGGFQLCDDARPEYYEVFGDSAVTYKAGDSADLARQVKYWLAHPDERAAYARAQHAAVQPHSWHARAADVLNILL